MKLRESSKYILYRAACDCNDPDCDLTLELEKDKEIPDMIFLNMYKKLRWSSYTCSTNFFTQMISRILVSLKVLFTGYIEVEECFVFKGKDHINSFIEALNEGKEKI